MGPASPRAPQIHQLRTQVSDSGALTLSRLSALVVLILSRTQVSSSSLRHLATALRLRPLLPDRPKDGVPSFWDGTSDETLLLEGIAGVHSFLEECPVQSGACSNEFVMFFKQVFTLALVHHGPPPYGADRIHWTCTTSDPLEGLVAELLRGAAASRASLLLGPGSTRSSGTHGPRLGVGDLAGGSCAACGGHRLH